MLVSTMTAMRTTMRRVLGLACRNVATISLHTNPGIGSGVLRLAGRRSGRGEPTAPRTGGCRLRRLFGSECALIALGPIILGVSLASAQAPEVNPVYVDDAPLAGEAMELIPSLLASGNETEAVRGLQRLLDESGDRLIEVDDDPGRFISVRRRVHQYLRERPDLLTLYRQMENARARALLAERGPSFVERTRLLTTAGYESALRLAQDHLEQADFEGARLLLEELLDHPDRDERLVALYAVVARYIPRDEVRRRARTLAGDPGEPITPPPAVVEPVHTPMDDAGPVDLSEMVSAPLHTIDLPGVTRGESSEVDFEVFAPWITPCVTSDEIIVCDGERITSIDRFTFERRWSSEPEGWPRASAIPNLRRRGRTAPEAQMQDISPAAAFGDTVCAITGWIVSYGRGGVSTRFGDPRLHALDRDTGTVRWSWHPGEADPELASAMLVGRPVIDAGRVLVLVRKQIASRRSLGTYLFALDLEDGRVLWHRLIGSAGSLPYQTQGGLARGDLTLRDGICYVSSEVGVVCAIRAHDGRFLWERVHPGVTFGAFDPGQAFALSPPVVHGDEVFVLTSDRSKVLRLDRASGRILGVRDARTIGEPRYLLGVAGVLVAVCDTQLTFTPMQDFERAGVRLAPYPSSRRVLGRVVPAGREVVVPLDGGLFIVNAATPSERRWLDLERSGMVVPLSGQIVACGATSLHGYLVWSVAQRVLSERMEREPDDPSPALTFARLSVQAGRCERLLETLDRAARAIDALPDETVRDLSRRRLFTMVLQMVRGQTPVPESLREGLIARLDAVAREPSQRVAALIERAAWLEEQSRFADAVDAYQSILTDEDLAHARWPGPRLSVRADLEATRRLRALIDATGDDLYARYAATAASQRMALGEAPDPRDLEALARRFPLASAAADAWLDAATIYERQGQGHLAVRALRQGLLAGPPEHATVARRELSGRLIRALVEQERWEEAARVLARALAGPEAPPTVDGDPLDLDALRARVRARIASRLALPRVGTPSPDGIITIEGWQLVRPLLRSLWRRIPYAPLIRLADEGTRLAVVFERDSQLRWQRPLARFSRIVRADPDNLLVLEPGADTYTVLCLNPADGSVRWRSEALRVQSFTPGATFHTPMDGPVRADEVVVAGDERTLVLCTRAGRMQAISLNDGRELWTAQTPVRRVHDVALGASIVAVAGALETPDDSQALDDFGTPALGVLDARTGQGVFGAGGEDEGLLASGEIRWVRITPDARVVAGLSTGLMSIDPIAGELAWVSDAQDLASSLDVWLVGDRAIVLSASRDLWPVHLDSGRPAPIPLDARQVTYARSRIELTPLERSLVVSSSRGVVVLDDQDTVVGLDAIPSQDTLLPAKVSSGSIVAIDAAPMPSGHDYALYLLDMSGRLIARPLALTLGEDNPPTGLFLLDQRICVSTRAGTVLIHAPAPDAGG